MKKILLVSILISCFAMVYGQKGTVELKAKSAQQVCTNVSFQSFDATFSFSEIQSRQISTEKGIFSEITIPQTFPTGNEGDPELPAARKLIAIPQGATPRVVVKHFDETVYNLDQYNIKTIYPLQPSVRKDMKPEDIKFVYNAQAYATKGFEKRPIAQVNVLGNMRGMRIGSLTVNPVVYDPSTNTIKVRNNIEVEVVFDGADVAATKSIYNSTYSIYFEPVYKQMFNRDVYGDHPDLYSTPIHMLVIAPDSYSDALQPWIAWKTMKGFYVDVHYTSETGTTYTAIKNFVYDKYNTGVSQGAVPTFLVLIGDTPQIPNTTGSSSQKVTDLYYSSVDGDDFPDMYCSRMCCSTPTELSNVIEKILCYEKVEGDTAYLAKALLIAGADASWNPQVGQPTVNYGTQYHFNADHGYTDVYAYLTSYNNCYSHLNTGVGLVNYTAHGSETGWYSPALSVSDVNSFTNLNKYFLAIGNCCLAADFGYSGVCFGEAMIRAHQKGAYTYIGSCPSTYWYEDYYWSVGATNVFSQTPTPQNSSTGMYDILNWDTAFNTTNSMMFLGNLAVCYAHDGSYQGSVSSQYYWQAYHCLGDGSVMPFCGAPSSNTISHMAIVPIGMNYYEVSAKPGSMVAISKDGVLYGTAVVGESGTVNVPLNPVITSAGNAYVVVTRHNTLPSIEEVPCAALNGPYLIGNGWTINDANNDGAFDYSETGTIGYSIKNVGSTTAENTIATVSTDDPYVTFTVASSNFGNIDANGIKTVDNAFTVTVAPNAPNNHKVVCTVTMTSSDTLWTTTIDFTLHAPDISLLSNGVEGELLPGETLNITATFINNGNADITNASGVYSTTCPYITVNTITPVVYGNIPAHGGTATGAFSITVSADAPFGTVIPSIINITADHNYTYAGEFEPFIDICNVAINNYPYTEGFEDSELPNCWTQETVSGTATWSTKNGGLNNHPYHAHTGSYNAYISGDSATVKLVSPLIDLSSISNPTLTFWHAQSVQNSAQDVLKVYYRNSTDGNWILLASYPYSIASWKMREIELPNTTSNYYIAFEANLNGGFGVVLDDIEVTGEGSTLLGDANGDGSVNLYDATVTVNYMLNENPSPFYFNNADVNNDGAINVMDVMGIVNIIINNTNTSTNCGNETPTAEYTVEDGILYVNTPVALGGIQVKFEAVSTVTPTIAMNNFAQSSSWTADNEYTYVAYSTTGTMFEAGKYPICKVNGNKVAEVVISNPFGCKINAEDGSILGIGNETSNTMNQVYPNPFSSVVNISYTVSSSVSSAEFVITNVNGQIVDRSNVEDITTGTHTFVWSPASQLTSGVYFITLNINGVNVQKEKVVYQK